MLVNKYQLVASMSNELPAHIYIHVPLCPRKCRFCMYYTVRNYSERTSTTLTERIVRELACYSEYSHNSACAVPTISTIYIGGGTPIEVGSHNLKNIVNAAWDSFEVADDAEISIEVFPDRSVLSMLPELSALGVNRLSIGVQTFSSSALAASARPRASHELVCDIILAARAHGIVCNVDLMYGLPLQKLSDVVEEVRYVVDLRPDQITNYRSVFGPYSAAFRMKEFEYYGVPGRETVMEAEAHSREISY